MFKVLCQCSPSSSMSSRDTACKSILFALFKHTNEVITSYKVYYFLPHCEGPMPFLLYKTWHLFLFYKWMQLQITVPLRNLIVFSLQLWCRQQSYLNKLKNWISSDLLSSTSSFSLENNCLNCVLRSLWCSALQVALRERFEKLKS